MKKICLLAVVFVFTAIMPQVIFGQCDKKVEAGQKEIELGRLLCLVRESFDKYQNVDLGDESIKLTSATISVNTTTSKKVGGGFSFWIISIGSSVTYSETSTLSFSFKLKKSNEKNKISFAQLDDKIAQAVEIARNAIIASKKFGDSSTVKLQPSFTYELNFGVSISAEGEIEIVIFKANANVSREKVHTLKLTFSGD